MPTIPVEAWQQVVIVIIFAMLLAGLSWTLGKILVNGFLGALAGIQKSFTAIISQNDARWQAFYNVELEAEAERTRQITGELNGVFSALKELNASSERLKDLLEDHEASSNRRHAFLASALSSLQASVLEREQEEKDAEA